VKRRIGSAIFRIAVLIWVTLSSAAAFMPVIQADEILENPDSSKTFIRPRILGESGSWGIGQGIPGACRLFGMEGYLKDYVVWSGDLKDAVSISNDGHVGEVQIGSYVEAMTCTSVQPYFPKITAESRSQNSDGSVTIRLPQIHHGPRHFPVLSGHAGACRLLGYSQKVEYSLEWSTRRARGVSLALDGQIYERATGTYLIALGCRDEL
jgi:hypothetical protein